MPSAVHNTLLFIAVSSHVRLKCNIILGLSWVDHLWRMRINPLASCVSWHTTSKCQSQLHTPASPRILIRFLYMLYIYTQNKLVNNICKLQKNEVDAGAVQWFEVYARSLMIALSERGM